MKLRSGLVLVVTLTVLAHGCDGSGGGEGADASADLAGGADVVTPPDTASGDLVEASDARADSVAPADVPVPPADVAPPPDVPVGPTPVCTAGTRWALGTPAFVERTDEWGLRAAGAEGVRINVFDYDGDGWADVLVRRASSTPDDFAEGGVRNTWLLRNREGAGFEDVTLASNLLVLRAGGDGSKGRPGQVYAAGDVDNDGFLDLYSGPDTSNPTATLGESAEIVRNDGQGGFVLGPEGSDVRRAAATNSPAGASFVDYDRDGNLDIWVTENGYTNAAGSPVLVQDRLFRGDGTGAFTDVTLDVGLRTEDWTSLEVLNGGLGHTRAWAAGACDLNGDGASELLSPSYGRAPNHLWQGQWTATSASFVNRSVASGYAYDDDMTWQDNEFARCYCEENRSAEGCADVPRAGISCGQTSWDHDLDREAFRLGGNSAATVCADIDNDGDIDLFTTEIRHWWAGLGADGSEVLENTGERDVRFERPGDEALGLAVSHPPYNWDEGHMTASIFDFDNDGWPDIYVGASDYAGNRGLLYHQDAALSFTEVPTSDFFEHNRSHGIAYADFDHDGDLDVIVGHSRARCDASAPNDCYATGQVRVFENTLGQDGNWVQVALVGGVGSNRAAIGARVQVTAGGVTQTQEVGGGYGHYGAQNDLVLHFGLGTACEADVSVRWPNGALTTESATLVAGHRFEWHQGSPPRALW